MKVAQSSHGSTEKLHIIDAIVWSDSLSAKLVDIHNSEVTANAKLDLAALATGAIVPNAEVRYVDAENQTVSIDAARTHWAYRSLPLKLDPANGLLEVDRSAPQLLLSPTYRKAAKMVVSR